MKFQVRSLAPVARSKAVKVAVALVAVSAMTAANAAIDVTAATAEIADVKTGVLAIGTVVFGVAVAVKLYKWLRAAL